MTVRRAWLELEDRRLADRVSRPRACARAAAGGRRGTGAGDALALPTLVSALRPDGGSDGRRGSGALVAGDGGVGRAAGRLRPLRDLPSAGDVRVARHVAATRDRPRFHAGRVDRGDGGAAGDGRGRSRPGALCPPRFGARARHGRHPLPGRAPSSGVLRGLLRQAGAARVHQRGCPDRDRLPARQALGDRCRRARLLRHRRGDRPETRRRERADRDSERGVAGGCARRKALPSCRTGVSRGARGRARHRGCRRSRSSRDRGHRGGERRPAAYRVAARRSTGLHRSAASGGSIRARRLRRHDRDRAHVREQARLHGRPEPRTERARRREPHRRVDAVRFRFPPPTHALLSTTPAARNRRVRSWSPLRW